MSGELLREGRALVRTATDFERVTRELRQTADLGDEVAFKRGSERYARAWVACRSALERFEGAASEARRNGLFTWRQSRKLLSLMAEIKRLLARPLSLAEGR